MLLDSGKTKACDVRGIQELQDGPGVTTNSSVSLVPAPLEMVHTGQNTSMNRPNNCAALGLATDRSDHVHDL